MGRASRTSWDDGIAIGVSALCLVHCLALPVMIALSPALSSLIGFPEQLHLLFIAIAFPVSSFAMVRGYQLHGAVLPAVWAVIGLALLVAGVLTGRSPLIETSLSVAGSLALVAGHRANWIRRVAAGRAN